MQLKIISSSSSGNSYLLTNGKETLVVEAGMPFKKVKEALNFDISHLVGVVCSHAHLWGKLDHIKYISQFSDAGINCYSSREALTSIGIIDSPFAKPIEPNNIIKVGGFDIVAFELEHDVRCFGYLIRHDDIGKLLFVTDTSYIPYKFNGLRNLMVECNYSEELINQSASFSNSVSAIRSRVMDSHIEIETLKIFLKNTDLSMVDNIILLHLSSSNSNAKEFKEDIERLTGKRVFIADSGMSINLKAWDF